MTAVTSDTITGTVPSGVASGVCALTVRNPDGQAGTLSPAYTALNVSSPDTTLETGYISTFGRDASGADGDDDHVQVIFFDVPDSTSGNLFVRLFDADVGGGLDEQQNSAWDTAITYTLRGGGGAYTQGDARLSRPGPAGIGSGVLLTQTVIANDPAYDGNWNLVLGPYLAADGESVGASRVFKLVVEGAGGDDGNLYNVALSTDSSTNTVPDGTRIFAYSWTFPLAPDAPQWLYPYVPSGTSNFVQNNWDMDSPAGSMALYTPLRSIAISDGAISENSTIYPDDVAASSHLVGDLESAATWTVRMEFSFPGVWNDLTFWVTDGADLAIFTRPTTDAPP